LREGCAAQGSQHNSYPSTTADGTLLDPHQPNGEATMVDDRELFDLLDEMESTGVLEDRREYDPDQLAKMYQLDNVQADDLFALIQRRFDPSIRIHVQSRILPIEQMPAARVYEYLTEFEEGNTDGWSEHQVICIMQFIDDMRRYCIASAKPE